MSELKIGAIEQTEGFEISGAILAGGKSKRMGRDKALLDVGGKPMISQVLERLVGLLADIMIVGDNTGRFDFLKLSVYPDEVKSVGPLSGIYTALKKARFPHVLIVACDLPFISRQLVHALCQAHGDTDITAARSLAGPEPLCAIYDVSCLPQIERQLAKGEHKVQTLLRNVETNFVELEQFSGEAEVMLNINTPYELHTARRKFGSRS